MKIKQYLSILVIAFLTFSSLIALTEWQQSEGPYGGVVHNIVTDGSTIFASTRGGGVFKSTNNAENWEIVSSGLTNPYVRSLAISDNYLFAGTTTRYGGSGGGIYRSDNEGESWELVNNGITDLYIQCITTDGDNIFAGTEQGIFLSENEGDSWNEINTGLTTLNVLDVLCTDSYVYASTSGGGIFRSEDYGSNWVEVNSGLTNMVVNALTVYNSQIFAATNEGIYRSSDNGENWIYTSSGLPDVGMMDIIAKDDVLYVATYSRGVYMSNDNGDYWETMSEGLSNGYIYSLLADGANLFAGTFGAGVYRFDSNEINWIWSSEGMNGADVRSFTQNDEYFFIGTGGSGVSRSDNQGENWTSVGLQNHWIYSLEAADDGEGGSVLLAGTMGEGIYRSTDNGDNWNESSTGITVPLIWSLEKYEFNDETWIFAGSYGGGVFYSTDLGQNWQSTAVVPGAPLITDFAYDGTYLYAASDQSGVFRSEDNGQSWLLLTSGLNNTYVHNLLIYNNAIYATTLDGVYKSTNNGDIWENCSVGIEESDSGYALIEYDGKLILGCSSNSLEAGGVYYSTNEANSWNYIADGLVNTNIRCLNIKGMNLLTGSYGGGLWYLPFVLPTVVDLIAPANGAELTDTVDFSWEESEPEIETYWFEYSSDPQFTTSVTDSSLTETNTQITFSEEGQYYWRVKASNAAGWGDFSEIRSLYIEFSNIDEQNIVPEVFALDGNYPNPFNPTTQIKFHIPERSQVTLKVINAKGRLVKTLINTTLEANSYSINWNGTNQDSNPVASGLYFYKLQAGEKTAIGKCLLMK